MITGDKAFGPGHPRFELQKSAVSELSVVYWGRGSWWPKTPAGPFDVVTVQDPFWRGLFAWFVARRMGAKLNVQVHVDLQEASGARKKSVRLGLAARSADFVGLRERIARFVLRHADSVRVVSQKIKEQTERLAKHTRIRVLPVFVDIERFKAIERHAESNTILWVGRFEEEKDPLRAIEVFEEVRTKTDARLVMLGSGSLESKLKERARGLPVEFPGWQDPLLFLVRANVVLSTSRQESWGASIVEALAAGIPVVAPDIGIAKEAGAVVVPPEHLAEAINDILHSGARGGLKFVPLSSQEWVGRWIKTLL
jgi:glycosyltransferase involved in cell wall biosynthesis